MHHPERQALDLSRSRILAGVTFKAADALLVLAGRPDNDLYRVLTTNCGNLVRCDTAAQAVQTAAEGVGVLILAEDYPAKTTVVEASVWEEVRRKKLRLYVEYPAALPALAVGQPNEDKLLRGVVTSGFFGAELTPMRIVTINDCRFVPVKAETPHMVLAKVAGVDTAVFGLTDMLTEPLLFEHGGVLVATTKLSQFVTGRYMPEQAWRTIWQTILSHLLPPGSPAPALKWTATVRPSYDREAALPADVEQQALHRSADWIVRSRILRHPQWPQAARDWSLTYNTVRPMPGADWPVGDGSLGVLEGFSSTIHADGSQPMRYAVRNDGTCEVAMLMALDAHAGGNNRNGSIAANLVNYSLVQSGLATGHRLDVNHPACGLVGWALDHTESYWGDDNARALLGMLAVAAVQKESQWDDAIARNLLGNLRTTGVNGFRERCLDGARLEKNGWQHYWQGQHVDYAPHMEAWLWACFLWAYAKTGFDPFLTRAATGARMLMAAYPKWEYTNGSGAVELARALLPLAWLVRVQPTPEHRQWLGRIAGDLIALQVASGAIREIIRTGEGPYSNCIPKSNAAYGTCETSLIQADGDTVADMLYTCNFALIGLHEAAAATGEPSYAEAERKLAEFLCRIQVRSEAHPELDGAWYRAFNFGNWQYWASNADGVRLDPALDRGNAGATAYEDVAVATCAAGGDQPGFRTPAPGNDFGRGLVHQA
ncbi:MAG: hypothetical protein NTV86_18265 [Planctomycetota bacterium]|nr:hypothetical protein [Planctomycetota bacterium]